LHSASFLKMFIRAKNFLVQFLWSFKYRIMSYASRSNLNYFFTMWISLICSLVVLL
jgi:hypothetical protein